MVAASKSFLCITGCEAVEAAAEVAAEVDLEAVRLNMIPLPYGGIF